MKVLSDSEDMENILHRSDEEEEKESKTNEILAELKETDEKLTGSAKSSKTKPKITIKHKTKDQTVTPRTLPKI